jgi:hypothetical protein
MKFTSTSTLLAMTTTMDPDLLDRAARRYDDLGAEAWSDTDLVAFVADRVRVPRAEPADSFVLHAPLEVLARTALLPWVAPEGVRAARLRLLTLLDEFESWAEADLPEPEVVSRSDAPDRRQAGRRLADALAAGDLTAADAAAAAVAHATGPDDLARTIGDAVLPNLAAAGHAPIFLYQLPRVAPRGEATPELLRPLARELARYPGLAIEWVRDRPVTGGSPAALERALADVPGLGIPGSTFIFPLMHQVDSTGVARRLLGDAAAGVTPDAAARVLLRTSARAMLLADPEHAPYGWSHCLTMPQAALAVANGGVDPQLAVDVAGTFVVGFLAALLSEPLPATVDLPSPGGTFAGAVAAGRDEAAGWVLHAPATAVGPTWTQIVTAASAHRDAHLVKYTLACLDAAQADPAAARLFQAAAASLLAYWEALAPTA